MFVCSQSARATVVLQWQLHLAPKPEILNIWTFIENVCLFLVFLFFPLNLLLIIVDIQYYISFMCV